MRMLTFHFVPGRTKRPLGNNYMQAFLAHEFRRKISLSLTHPTECQPKTLIPMLLSLFFEIFTAKLSFKREFSQDGALVR